MLSEKSTAHLSDSDLYEALATLGQEPAVLRAERAYQIRQLMLAELDAQQARASRAGWLGRLFGAPAASLAGRRLVPAMAALALVLLLGGAATLQFLLPMATSQQIAQVSVAAGVVHITRAVPIVDGIELTRHLTVAPGEMQDLHAGDSLDSDADASANIQFPGGSVSTVGPNARLIISQLQERTATTPLAIAMHLERGAMRSDVAGLRPEVDKFELSMPGLVAHVKGTVFRVDVHPSITYLATDEGVVQVSYDGTSAEVAAGEELAVLLQESAPVAWVRPQTPRLTLAAPPLVPQTTGAPGEAIFYTNESTLAWRIETVPNASVLIYINDKLTQTVTADVDGTVMLDFSPPQEGAYVITAKIETVAGESSQLSTPQTVLFDQTPPSLVLTNPQDPYITGQTVAVAGQTEAGAQLTINGQAVTVDADGSFAATLDLVPGPNDLRLAVVDRAGNEVQLNSVLIVE